MRPRAVMVGLVPRSGWRAFALLSVAIGCESEPVASPRPAEDVRDPDAAGGEPGWSTLVQADWTLAPGKEGFFCALQTVPSEVLIRAFRANAPHGTHHTVVTVTQATGPDRVFECEPGTLSDAMIFASGPGTGDLRFPEGVAIRVPAGKQILLNVHVFNASRAPLEATSGILIQTLNEDAVKQEAEVVFAGTTDFTLAPGASTSAHGSCAFQQDATLLSVWPHMHQLGRHMTVVHHTDTGDTTLHDGPFQFTHQGNVSLNPTLVRAGERIDVTCQWTNSREETVVYGDSSADEMCFAGLYRYPASSTGLYCDVPGL